MAPGKLNEDEFRLAMAERAIGELRARMGDISQSLAALAGYLPPLPRDAFAIDAKQVSEFFDGFYPCENDADARPFRWTGKADFFELRVHLDRNCEWKFRMVIRFPTQLQDAKLVAFADFVPIEIDSDATTGIVTGVIPTQPFSNRLSLTFYCDKHFCPKEVEPASLDNRRLALSFYEISFAPLQPATRIEETADPVAADAVAA